ncbi:2OG-Fe(II) oxygenase [Parafrankia sp. FMc6]|uniref:2OG-Fe(II) oxygenase n=1 Tax=Parafrankia soli TaxID=2599596 RepID=UPI0034D7B216
MALLKVIPELLPIDQLTELRDATENATSPESMGARGPSPYHLTFWYDVRTPPRNLVERLVLNTLFPLLTEFCGQPLAGVEWWLGRLAPPYADNFEFGVHRDFGEEPGTGLLTNPTLSSVFYLTTVEDGPLVVWDGLPRQAAQGGGTGSECTFPRANTFVMFPGDRWHTVSTRQAVLGRSSPSRARSPRLSVTVNAWRYRPVPAADPPMKLVAADYDGDVYPQLCV